MFYFVYKKKKKEAEEDHLISNRTSVFYMESMENKDASFKCFSILLEPACPLM